ncbi:MAG: hypothetical protein ACK559_24630, partial [bacterium]
GVLAALSLAPAHLGHDSGEVRQRRLDLLQHLLAREPAVLFEVHEEPTVDARGREPGAVHAHAPARAVVVHHRLERLHDVEALVVGQLGGDLEADGEVVEVAVGLAAAADRPRGE